MMVNTGKSQTAPLVRAASSSHICWPAHTTVQMVVRPSSSSLKHKIGCSPRPTISGTSSQEYFGGHFKTTFYLHIALSTLTQAFQTALFKTTEYLTFKSMSQASERSWYFHKPYKIINQQIIIKGGSYLLVW